LILNPVSRRPIRFLLKGRGIYVEGDARLDQERQVVTVDVKQAKRPDGSDVEGHFYKLAYRPTDLPTDQSSTYRLKQNDNICAVQSSELQRFKVVP